MNFTDWLNQKETVMMISSLALISVLLILRSIIRDYALHNRQLSTSDWLTIMRRNRIGIREEFDQDYD